MIEEAATAVPRARIVHAFTSAGGSMGVDVAIRELAIAQARAGADVHLLVKGAWSDPAVLAAGIPVHRSETNGMRRTLLTLLDGPTVLHTHVVWSPTTLLPLLVGRRPGLRTVASPHGCLAPAALAQKRWKKRVGWHLAFGSALRAHDALIATSDAERADCLASCPRLPVLLVPNAIAAPTAAAADVGKQPVVGFLGRIDPIKGVAELIAAWRLIADAHPGWRLRIAGPDGQPDYAAQVRALAATIPSIAIEGPVFGEEKWRFLHECSVIAVPSRAENFCLVVAESYLMGTPVITTLGVPWPQLTREHIGWRGADGPDSIAAMLNAALGAGAATRATMGERGRAFVEANFGHGVIAGRSFAAYRQLVR